MSKLLRSTDEKPYVTERHWPFEREQGGCICDSSAAFPIKGGAPEDRHRECESVRKGQVRAAWESGHMTRSMGLHGKREEFIRKPVDGVASLLTFLGQRQWEKAHGREQQREIPVCSWMNTATARVV